jgi:hypothetical protein
MYSANREETMPEEQTSESQATPEDLPTNRAHFNCDWFLQTLVDMANNASKEGSIEFPITLQVGGLLVSGHLTSGRNFFEGLADDLKSGLDQIPGWEKAGNEDIVAPFRQLGKHMYETPEQESTDPKDTIKKSIEFIHLRNARIMHPGGSPVPNNRPVWWRGRLEAVDAFFLGGLA